MTTKINHYRFSHLAIVCALFAMGTAAASAQTPPPGGVGGAPAGMPPENPLMKFKVADAGPDHIRIMVTAAFMEPVEAVRAEAEKAIGHPIYVEYGSARGNLKNEILAGQEFEVAILLPDVNSELLQHGKIINGEHQLAVVKVAVGLRGDIDVDISNAEALKKTLLGASVVRYSPTGVALPTVRKLLNDLGIADAINDASKSGNPAVAPNIKPVPPGQYEINLFPLSEINRMKGITNLGLVIDPFQVPEPINAVVGAKARNHKAAWALVRYLQSSALDPAVKKAGMSRDEIFSVNKHN